MPPAREHPSIECRVLERQAGSERRTGSAGRPRSCRRRLGRRSDLGARGTSPCSPACLVDAHLSRWRAEACRTPSLHSGTMITARSVPVIDLFAGAGGFGIAATQARAKLRLSVEIDPVACSTLTANAGTGQAVRQADLTQTRGRTLRRWAGLDRLDPLVVIGGAPCQPFSKAAYWLDDGQDSAWRRDRARGIRRERPVSPLTPRADGRRSLVDQFARLVIEARADGFVFENVAGIEHPRNRGMLSRLLTTVSDAGYNTTLVRALASDFGVAQHRARVFVLGSRYSAPIPPKPTHDGRGSRSDVLLPPVSAREACKPFGGRQYFEPEEVITGRWADHLRQIPPGSNYKFHTAWAEHPSPTFVAETRYWNFLLVLDPRRPAWTIPAQPGPWVGPFHWKHRRLRVPELAALQGFPVDYMFTGTRRERVRQIGNAVPPPMAAPMVRSVVSTLSKHV